MSECQGNKRLNNETDYPLISVKSLKIIQKILLENPVLKQILFEEDNVNQVRQRIRQWVFSYIQDRQAAFRYYKGEVMTHKRAPGLSWRDIAAIRLLDYLDNAGSEFNDMNNGGKPVRSEPYNLLWLAVRFGKGGANSAFFRSMLEVLRQFNGISKQRVPSRMKVLEWMDRHPSGLAPGVVRIREANKHRIVEVIIDLIDSGEIADSIFFFESSLNRADKIRKVYAWWNNHLFHLRFAARTPERINQLLSNTLDKNTFELMKEAEKVGIPFFVNPYYLSLLTVNNKEIREGADLPIRCYVFYSPELIDQFGQIQAWEKEDIIEPGIPNAAGWMLPSYHNIHRRYPEVAILIPDTMGRACAGLCSVCQRMYDFQRGELNFNLEKLKPRETWPEKLQHLLRYFEQDSQLRDILITGGDALMSSDQSLERILDAVYTMAYNKKKANEVRPDGEKYAEIIRVRLGTRLPVYLPQRINDSLITVLLDFSRKAKALGVSQLVVQTHFETAMEITPEAREAILKLHASGWIVTNQHVFTAQASRRGHSAKLRQVLNDIGVLPYYTFTVKGHRENYASYVTNARAVQEQVEEKMIGAIPDHCHDAINDLPLAGEQIIGKIEGLRRDLDLPFLATDRNVLNLPAVGKSMTYRVIGVTNDGRRILKFEHDQSRQHSPVIERMKHVIVIEPKSLEDYLVQLEEMGENPEEYKSIFGYSIGETEPRLPIYDYPEYDFNVTDKLTNFHLDS